jgi:peptide deformylase
MAIRPIVVYPDRVLLEPTRPVEVFDDELRELVNDMVDTMYAAPGVGLAANQVGVSKRLLIIDLTAGEQPDQLFVFVNPKITRLDGKQVGDEGCLSFPELTLTVARAQEVTVEAQDLDGRIFELEAEELMARAIQHECEHLDGQVFLRNISSLKRELVKRDIRKRINAGDWTAATGT